VPCWSRSSEGVVLGTPTLLGERGPKVAGRQVDGSLSRAGEVVHSQPLLVPGGVGSGDGIFLFRSTNGGDTWTPNGGRLIVSGSQGDVNGAWVTVGPDHAVYVAWFDERWRFTAHTLAHAHVIVVTGPNGTTRFLAEGDGWAVVRRRRQQVFSSRICLRMQWPMATSPRVSLPLMHVVNQGNIHAARGAIRPEVSQCKPCLAVSPGETAVAKRGARLTVSWQLVSTAFKNRSRHDRWRSQIHVFHRHVYRVSPVPANWNVTAAGLPKPTDISHATPPQHPLVQRPGRPAEFSSTVVGQPEFDMRPKPFKGVVLVIADYAQLERQ
jgi:hypothetical protein